MASPQSNPNELLRIIKQLQARVEALEAEKRELLRRLEGCQEAQIAIWGC